MDATSSVLPDVAAGQPFSSWRAAGEQLESSFWAIASPVLNDGGIWAGYAVDIALSWPLESLLLVLCLVVLTVNVWCCLRTCFGASAGKDEDGVHVPPSAAAVSLPAGWQTARDPRSGKLYYFNDATGEVSWTPWTCSKTQGRPLSIAKVVVGLPDGWETARDLGTGKPYYFNRGTGEVLWTPPVAAPRSWVSTLLPHRWFQRKHTNIGTNGKSGKHEEGNNGKNEDQEGENGKNEEGNNGKKKSCLKTSVPRSPRTPRRKVSISEDTAEPRSSDEFRKRRHGARPTSPSLTTALPTYPQVPGPGAPGIPVPVPIEILGRSHRSRIGT